jgi:hypothetical protein
VSAVTYVNSVAMADSPLLTIPVGRQMKAPRLSMSDMSGVEKLQEIATADEPKGQKISLHMR